eukprot:347878_1
MDHLDQNNTQILKQGWLEKKSKYIREWRLRWTVITSTNMMTYKSRLMNNKPTATIPLSSINSVELSTDCILTIVADSTYQFKAETNYIMKEWLKVINTCKDCHCIKLPVRVECACATNAEFNSQFDLIIPFDEKHPYNINMLFTEIIEQQTQHEEIKFVIAKIKSDSFIGQEIIYSNYDWDTHEILITDYDQNTIIDFGISLEIDLDISLHNTKSIQIYPNEHVLSNSYVNIRYQNELESKLKQIAKRMYQIHHYLFMNFYIQSIERTLKTNVIFDIRAIICLFLYGVGKDDDKPKTQKISNELHAEIITFITAGIVTAIKVTAWESHKTHDVYNNNTYIESISVHSSLQNDSFPVHPALQLFTSTNTTYNSDQEASNVTVSDDDKTLEFDVNDDDQFNIYSQSLLATDEPEPDSEYYPHSTNLKTTKHINRGTHAINRFNIGIAGSSRISFTDYAPHVFRFIRTKLYKMSDKEYMESILPQMFNSSMHELAKIMCDGFKGKVKKTFEFTTLDNKYLIQRIHAKEAGLLIDILFDYVKYMKEQRNTYLPKYCGLYCVKIYSQTIFIVVFNNVFSVDYIQEKYDINGAWVNRRTAPGLFGNEMMMDDDLVKKISFDEILCAKINVQLMMDTQFLLKKNIMGYSLFLGISYQQNDNKINKDMLLKNNSQLKVEKQKIFCYFGIGNILQRWNTTMKVERLSNIYLRFNDQNGITTVEPLFYRKRFMKKMDQIGLKSNKLTEL